MSIDTPQSSRSSALFVTVLVTLTALVVVGLVAGAGVVSSVTDGSPLAGSTDQNVSEDAYIEAAPEPGDEWFEAEAADGSWISYVNPRDEYRDPYLGQGSGKICVALLNEAGEPITGETVPGTTITVPTGESLEWHSSADPMVVQYPVTDHYERPLDADQFGTAEHVPQGDGYMDSHCIEFHGLHHDGDEISYGEAFVEGEHADRIEIVGYIQQDGQAWDSDVDPIDDAVSHEEAGGNWVYEPDGSHGQVVVVAQLTGADSANDENGDDSDGGDGIDSDDSSGEDDSGGSDNSSDDHGSDDGSGADDTPPPGDDSNGTDDATGDDDQRGDDGTNGEGGDSSDGTAADDPVNVDDLPGFGALVALLAVVLVVGVMLRGRHR
ncbi:PGF-CTERM sorting domain-containing protein [Halobacteria archaeon AArc-curdl1]|uniref:PGF-CTERM sorting domain-containing protein n=1 Tax=Natronosalvus hydrolyticus TaxID=2979988 RepID=A0AAP3E721_9EURY|nr:PGF-CTERM sorting domain-containing protein [Halobacteria archaeon AArc-curdl1]